MGYLTYLDVFVLAAFTILACVTTQNVVGVLLIAKYGSRFGHQFLYISGTTLSAIWGAVHLMLPLALWRAGVEKEAADEAAVVKEAANMKRWRLSADADSDDAAAALTQRPISRGFATPRKLRLDPVPEEAPAAAAAAAVKMQALV